MELINSTPVTCGLKLSVADGSTTHRFGFLTAKATFSVDSQSQVRLESQSPYPLFNKDEPCASGVLPSDAVLRRDRVLEVLVLGSVHGHGKAQQVVELAVGSHRHSLLVTGNRRWSSHDRSATISNAAPFDTVPMTWGRAYGGTAECWIDEHSVIDLEHPMNRYGVGFDAIKVADDVGKAFRAPAGYPRLAPGYKRALPNFEHPRHLIQRWDDEPRPYCWAPIPTDIGVHIQRAHDHMSHHKKAMSVEAMMEMVYHRAHPDWIIPVPEAQSMVSLKGMTSGRPWQFRLPSMRVLADFELGIQTGTHDLAPQLLMLLPDESRFYLVYRHFFTMETTSDMQRSFRVRLAEGWKQ